MAWQYPVSKYFYRRLSQPLARALARTPVRANHVTLTSFFAGLAAAVLIAQELRWIVLPVLLLSAILDCTDGDLARLRKEATRFGAYLDHMLDRWIDGLLVIALVSTDPPQLWLVGLIAMMGSYLATAPRTKAEAEGVACKVGIGGRDLRMLIWLAGLAVGRPFWLLVALATVGLVTCVQRTSHALVALRHLDDSQRP